MRIPTALAMLPAVANFGGLSRIQDLSLRAFRIFWLFLCEYTLVWGHKRQRILTQQHSANVFWRAEAKWLPFICSSKSTLQTALLTGKRSIVRMGTTHMLFTKRGCDSDGDNLQRRDYMLLIYSTYARNSFRLSPALVSTWG